MLNRRTFTSLVAAASAAPLLPRLAQALGSSRAARNIVLVDGLFADGFGAP